MKSKTTITVETWHVTSLRRNTANFGGCETSGSEMESHRPDEAAQRADIGHEAVSRQVARGELHLAENSGRMAASDDGSEV